MTTGLQIKPHSHRLSRLAVAGLSLLAAGSFVTGIQREIAGEAGPSPFPTAQAPAAAAGAIPDARPAPDIPVAASAPPVRRRPATPTDDTSSAEQDALPAAAVAAERLPTADASAAAPEPAPPPAPPPAPEADPNTPPT